MPGPTAGLREKNREAAEAVIKEIIDGLTKPPTGAGAKDKSQEEIITVTGKDYVEAFENMNNLFLERNWGDGFTLIPPTKEAVEAILKGTSHAPDEVIGVLDQRRGIATVKNVAINAVMAGCKPEYLPVVLAAVKAITNPAYNMHGVQATTAPAIPFLMVNGPIRNQLKMNSGMGSWGPGNRANSTIGRAFNLVMTTVGGRPEATMSSVSDPGRYSWCAGENEEELPPGWVPMHVDRGFKPTDSAVTVMNVHWRSPIHGFFMSPTDDEAIELVSRVIREQEPHWYGDGVLALLPEIAAQLARKAPTKYDLKKILMETSKAPYREVKLRQQARIGDFPPKGVVIPSDDTMVSPLMSKPEDLNIFVTGGAGRHSYLLYPWIRTYTVIESIDNWK